MSFNLELLCFTAWWFLGVELLCCLFCSCLSYCVEDLNGFWRWSWRCWIGWSGGGARGSWSDDSGGQFMSGGRLFNCDWSRWQYSCSVVSGGVTAMAVLVSYGLGWVGGKLAIMALRTPLYDVEADYVEWSWEWWPRKSGDLVCRDDDKRRTVERYEKGALFFVEGDPMGIYRDVLERVERKRDWKWWEEGYNIPMQA